MNKNPTFTDNRKDDCERNVGFFMEKNGPEKISKNLEENMKICEQMLAISKSFDLLERKMTVGGRACCFYFVDGFTKDEAMLKIMDSLYGIAEADMPATARQLVEDHLPYVEVELLARYEDLGKNLFAGVLCLFVDGYDCCIAIDCRTYPARGVEEPQKDKVLRGSRDGFVETLIFNTALIRRRIRDADFRVEIQNVGRASKTDVVLCYMDGRVDQQLLGEIRKRLQTVDVDALTMNQESLAECLYKRRWYNPFPKFKYTERPDTVSACILEGNIVILVDNSPAAMVLPSSVFDIIEEADDYYFPPVTGTYLRLSRMMTGVLCLLLTPTWLLGMMHADVLPQWLAFTKLSDMTYVPLIFQLLILEFAIDGLRLAAINTPSMLTTPLSVIAGIVLGEYSVKSGWFNSETMLYMAFVTIANYSQSSFELGYALKFMRVILLLLTAVFDVWGYITGFVIAVCAIVFNKTIAGKSYIYPIIPFSWKELKKRFFRGRLPVIPESQNVKR